MIMINKLCFFVFIFILVQTVFIQKGLAFQDYSYGLSKESYDLIFNKVPLTPLHSNNVDLNFSNSAPKEVEYIQNNYSNSYSGSTHFIYSSSPNPTYCIPGSSYSICH